MEHASSPLDPELCGVVEVVTVVDDAALAAGLAELVVAAGSAACAQVEGPVRSTYRWKGEIRTDEEWRVVAKTTDAAADAVVDAWVGAHPYDVPEVLVAALVGGHPAYLDWVRDEVALSRGSL